MNQSNKTIRNELAKSVRIDDFSRGQEDSIPGYYIVSGEGFTYRFFMWAKNLPLAKRALAQVRREIRAGVLS
jgi:hypothetical protein